MLSQTTFFLSFFIEVQLIYHVVLVSGVQQSDSVIYIIYLFVFRLLSLIGCYKILNIILHAIQQVLVGYLFYRQQCVSVNRKFLIYSPDLFPSGEHKFVFYVCKSTSVLQIIHLYQFLRPHVSDIIYFSFSIWLTSLV